MSNTYWNIEIPIIVRNLINDTDNHPTYTDDRIKQLIIVSANYVLHEANMSTEYVVDTVNETITPDPSAPNSRDNIFIGLLALKSACMLDQSTFRTKAVSEGIRASLGSANIGVGGNLAGYQKIIEIGPCKLYSDLLNQHNIGNATAVSAVLSPFVGNNFDPRYLLRGSYRGSNNEFFT